MTDDEFANPDDVPENVAETIAQAVHSLKAPSGMEYEDWYHDLPLWMGIEIPRASEPYRVAQVGVFFMRGAHEVEVVCERRRESNGGTLLARTVQDQFTSRLPLNELDQLRDVLEDLWMRAISFPLSGGSWLDSPTEPLPKWWEERISQLAAQQSAADKLRTYERPAAMSAGPPPPQRPSVLVVDYRTPVRDPEQAAREADNVIELFAAEDLPVTAQPLESLNPPESWVGTGGPSSVALVTVALLFERKLTRIVRGRTFAQATTEQVWASLRSSLLQLFRNPAPRISKAFVQVAFRFGSQWVLFRLGEGREEAFDAIQKIRVEFRVSDFLEFTWQDNAWLLKAT